MMELINDIVIKCRSCGEIIVVSKDNYDYDTYSYDHGENGMGDEIQYTLQDEIFCPECGNVISFSASGYEYPVGAFNFEDCEISGGDYEENPHFGVVYYHDEFDFQVAEIEYNRIHYLIQSVLTDKNALYSLTPREFEQVVERVFQDNGFETLLTPETRDGGKDIVATKYVMGKPVVFYVECKKYGYEKTIGINIVRQLYGVQMADRVNKAVLVTTAHFSSDARDFAAQQNTLIDLFDIDEFHELLRNSAKKSRFI